MEDTNKPSSRLATRILLAASVIGAMTTLVLKISDLSEAVTTRWPAFHSLCATFGICDRPQPQLQRAGTATPVPIPPHQPTLLVSPDSFQGSNGQERADGLANLLNSNAIASGLTPSNALSLLGDITPVQGRYGLLLRLMPLLQKPVPVDGALQLLSGIHGGDRERLLRGMDGCLDHPVSDTHIAALIGDIDMANRYPFQNSLKRRPGPACGIKLF